MPDIRREKETEAKWEEAWERDWKPLLYTDGKLDIQKIKNEMHDLWFIFEQVSEVYCEVTGNKLSKPMYYASEIIGCYHEQLNDAYDEGFSEGESNPPQYADDMP